MRVEKLRVGLVAVWVICGLGWVRVDNLRFGLVAGWQNRGAGWLRFGLVLYNVQFVGIGGIKGGELKNLKKKMKNFFLKIGKQWEIRRHGREG